MCVPGRGHAHRKARYNRADGCPHVAPIWFVIDGADLLFNTNSQTLKGKALLRDARAALTVDLEEPPFTFVTVEGTVTIETDPVARLPHSIAMARRYIGAGRAEEYGRRNAVQGELPIRLHPTHIAGYTDIGGH
ncbi:MAG TPA: PPOX class F420-dependent oxidoreductase [Jatrophihabitantaceae bacterium]|nr:PPOX class F420-dependent oxidoreductase [Jatrophihabitantaceae bacterium]